MRLPLPRQELDARIADHLDELVRLWRAEQGLAKERDLRILASSIPFPRDRAVRALDLACGPGDVGRTIRETYPQAQVDFVDRDPMLLAICRGFNEKAGVPGTYRELDLADDSWSRELESGAYDVVATANALHWLDETRADAVLRDVFGLLRAGGVFLLAEPASPDSLFAPGFDEWKQRQPPRYEQERWHAFWGRLNSLVGYDHTMLLGSPEDSRIGDTLTVAGWIELVENGGFRSVDVLWRDADVVNVAAERP